MPSTPTLTRFRGVMSLLIPRFVAFWYRPGERRKGTRKGRCQAPPKGPSRQHSGYHQARHSSPCPSWWCEANLGTHLRRNARSAEGLFGECYSRFCYLHGTRPPQDGDGHGRCLRIKASRKDFVRVWWIKSAKGLLVFQFCHYQLGIGDEVQHNQHFMSHRFLVLCRVDYSM